MEEGRKERKGGEGGREKREEGRRGRKGGEVVREEKE